MPENQKSPKSSAKYHLAPLFEIRPRSSAKWVLAPLCKSGTKRAGSNTNNHPALLSPLNGKLLRPRDSFQLAAGLSPAIKRPYIAAGAKWLLQDEWDCQEVCVRGRGVRESL